MRGKTKFYLLLLMAQFILVLIVFTTVNSVINVVGQTSETTTNSDQTGMLGLSAAIAVSVSVLGAAMSIKTTGTAAISALTENEGAFFKAFLVVVLGEALAIYGLIVAILLWTKIP